MLLDAFVFLFVWILSDLLIQFSFVLFPSPCGRIGKWKEKGFLKVIEEENGETNTNMMLFDFI